MKFIYSILIFIISSLSVFAQDINSGIEEENSLERETQQNIDFGEFSESIEKQFVPQIPLGEEFIFDISHIQDMLENNFPERKFYFLWDIENATNQDKSIFSRVFLEKGEKEILLTIGEDIAENEMQKAYRTVLFQESYSLLVYDKSFLLLYFDENNIFDIENYIDFARKEGIFIFSPGKITSSDLENSSILNIIKDYKQNFFGKSDYILLWGARNFTLDLLSNLNKDIAYNSEKQSFNFVNISSNNLPALDKYLKNFFGNKSWIDTFLILGESTKYNILKNNQILNLIEDLEKNQFEYLLVDYKQVNINNYLFISNFVNNLSNMGFGINSIYIFLVIPIVLTLIVIFKHFIGFSPIGISIPLFVTLLFLKVGVIISFGFIIFFIILNLILSLITQKYNMLYTPRLVFLIGLNIIFLIIGINLIHSFELITLNVSDIIYFIIFILLSEKMIQIIASKDLLEYKESTFYTFLIAFISFGILNIQEVKVFLISYPEIILITIPLNFMLGRFSGLRITEYFRFREIIKSIEE